MINLSNIKFIPYFSSTKI